MFDVPMRKLGTSAPEDPENPALWTPGGGLPAITSVIRRSDVEFELLLTSPAPLAGGYTVTIAGTAQSMADGTPMNPAFVTQTFAVTVADLIVSSIVWVSPSEFDVVFSATIATIEFDVYADVVQISPIDLARQPAVIGLSQSGATLRVTLEAPFTAGARYAVNLNREVFVDNATNVTLLAGQESQMAWGQGQAPTLTALAITEEKLTATCSQTLGKYPDLEHWPLFPGVYNLSAGSLGSTLEEGTSPALLVAPEGSHTLGASETFGLATVPRTVAVGASWLNQASSAVGAGTETVGIGTTTLNKTAGAPFEVLFTGGMDSMARAGRGLTTTMAIAFTPSVTVYPFVAFTLLNSQVSVVIEKTSTNLAVAKLYRGNTTLAVVSKAWNPAVAFTFELLDATFDYDGFVAVKVNGEVVLGAPAKDLLDPLLLDAAASNTALAVTLGAPTFPAVTFSVTFSANMVLTSYIGIGLRGFDSKDLFSFSANSLTSVVTTGANPPLSPGYQGTGKAAFGIHAEYLDAVDAVQVIIGLNEDAQPLQFTGSVSLLTGTEQVMDQVLLDQSHVLVGGNEIVVVFLHPKSWVGILAGVSLEIGGDEFSVVVPVIPLGQPAITSLLVQQPARWYHPRLSNEADIANMASFGPAAVIQTPN